MTFFNFSVTDLDIPQKYKDLFDSQQQKVNELLYKLDRFIKESESTISLNFNAPKTLKDISSNSFNISLYASYQGTYIKFILNENKSGNNIDNIENFQKLSLQLNELLSHNDLFDIYTKIIEFKKTVQKINSLLYAKTKNVSLDSIAQIYKSFYIDDKSELIKNKPFVKYCCFKDNINNMIIFREKEAKLFLPIFIPQNNTYESDFHLEDQQFLNNYKKEFFILNKHIVDLIPENKFYFSFLRTQINAKTYKYTVYFSISYIKLKELSMIEEKLNIKNNLENF